MYYRIMRTYLRQLSLSVKDKLFYWSMNWMGDYRYTELSYKITSLISRTCCRGSSGLTYTWADAGVMPFICDSYRNITTKILSIHFNYLFLLLLISLEPTTPHVRWCPFIFAVLYTQVPTVAPPNRWPGCIYDLPLYHTLYIINLQCTHSL